MKKKAGIASRLRQPRALIALLPVAFLLLAALLPPNASLASRSANRGLTKPALSAAAPSLPRSLVGRQQVEATPLALSPLAQRLIEPRAVDYHPPSNQLLLATRRAPAEAFELQLIASDGRSQRFSSFSATSTQVRLVVVREPLGKMLPGDVFLSATPATITRITAGGATVQDRWVRLPGEKGMIAALCLPSKGVFRGHLIVATEAGRLWMIDEAGKASLIADLATPVAGLLMVPDDAARYGEWAGKLLVGAKAIGGLYAVDASGKVAYFNLPIYPQDIEIIPREEDFFGLDSKNGVLWKASATQFASQAGNILIAQESPGILMNVRWTGKQFSFETIAQAFQWEQVTFAPNCTTSISPTSAFYSVQPGDGALTISAPGACNWTAVSNQPWLEITSADNGTGNGEINYVVQHNNDRTARQGTITVNGLVFTVTQDGGLGEDCTYLISPGFDAKQAAGGAGVLNVFAEERCAWQATSNSSFVVITSGCCGMGNGTVTYVVSPNGGSGRSGTIAVGGKAFTVKQKANQPPIISAGADQTIALPNTASLSGTIIDDNAPVSATVSWSKVSGPESVILGSASTAPTSAIFNSPGTYVLRFTATDSVFTISDDVVITVNPDPTPPPPDPMKVAPPLDMTVVTTIGAATQFLYSGPNPIQTGVAPGTIKMERAAVLRGRVLDKNATALPLVKVTVLNHPEFGQTMSRADGRFDIAVNGGGLLTVNYEKVGFLQLQRCENVPWQDYEGVPDVVMMSYDPAVTFIDLNSTAPIQVAQSTPSTDTFGTRRTTFFFKQGTTATMTLPGGAMQGLDILHVRATEFTVGANGVAAMPGDLPSTSAYTYAAAYTIDEAVAVNAVEVSFNQPVVEYNENFLNFPVGTSVPSGSYDKQLGLWLPSANGRIVRILSVSGGQANLDITGGGTPAGDVDLAALGINTAERQQLALSFSVGQSLWRVPVMHFSYWDSNLGFGPPAGSGQPNGGTASSGGGGPAGSGGPNGSNDCPGCILGIQDQRLSEEVDVVGTRFFLRYDSTRPRGRVSDYTVRIPLSGATLLGPVKRIELTVSIAGQLHEFTFSAQTDQITSFTWDGKDAYGRDVQGQQEVLVDIGNVYDGVYQNIANFGYSGNGVPITVNTRQELTLHRRQRLLLGVYSAPPQTLGGWTLSEHHAYDPMGQKLYEGNGKQRNVQTVSNVIETFAGGLSGFLGDGGPVSGARFARPVGVATGPDGSVYVADTGNRRIRKIAPNGIVTTVAGNGGGCAPTNFPCGDGGPATSASFGGVGRVAVASDGSLYISGLHNVWRVTPDGIFRRVAGTAFAGFSGDGGPARDAQLSAFTRAFPASDGSVYVSDFDNGSVNHRIRRIDPNGIITTIAGNGTQGFSGDGGPATSAALNSPGDIVAAPDGNVYFIDQGNNRIRRIAPDGIITTIAGTGALGNAGDGGPALQATFFFSPFNPGATGSMSLAPDGSLYIVSYSFAAGRVRRIGPDGIITGIAGNGQLGSQGDGGPALQSQAPLAAIGLAPDSSIYTVGGGIGLDDSESRIRRVSSPLPGFTATQIAIPAEDGTQLFRFDAQGRHLNTVNTLTGATVYSFAYDGAGRLNTVTDGDNNVTTIQRNGAGQPTGILSPYNQLTTFTLNAGGYLATITNPASEQYQFTYNAAGQILTERDPRNNQNQFTYDANGRLTRDDDPAAGFQTLTRTGQDSDFTVTRNTALNRQTGFRVQTLGILDRNRINTLPDATQEVLLERANGLKTFTDPDGTITNEQLGGDPRWKLQAPLMTSTTVATPGGLNYAETFTRAVSLTTPGDPLSLATQTDTETINGQATTSAFTASNRTFVNTSPLNRQVTGVIDTQGRLTSFQLANLNPLAATYDTRGRLATTVFGTGGDARTSTFAYNPGGFLASFTDALNRVTGNTYDAAGRVTQQTTPDSRIIGFGYDAKGNLTSLTPPGRPAHTFSYNAVDLVAMYTPPAVADTGATQFAYNLDRQLTSITQPGGVMINYGYDLAGRLSTRTIAAGAYNFSYSATTGKLTGLTAPSGPTLSFGYDGFLPTSQTWSGVIAGSVSQTFNNFFLPASQSVNGGNTVTFTYDNDNLLTGAGSLAVTRDAQNGLMTGATVSSITDTRGYNGFGELATYSTSFNATPLYSFSFTRDNLGRVTQKVETIGGAPATYDYTYDPAGRLQEVKLDSVTISSYTYDSNDNRLTRTTSGGTVTGTYDNQDRMTAYGAATYAYTANGELSSKTAGAQTTTYSYDALGNLRNATLPDSTELEYVIDGLNRRAGKRVNGTLAQGFLYQDQLEPVAELDGSNNIVGRFVYGTRTNTPDYVVKDGVTYRILTDHLGSVRLVVDAASGAIAQRLDYDEFGVVTMDSSPGFQPFGFAGGLYDSQTKLTRFGARDYDAETGRWTTKDPILFGGGDTNLYSYVSNDPLNYLDPSGFAKTKGGGGKGKKKTCGGKGGGSKGDGNASGGGSKDGSGRSSARNPGGGGSSNRGGGGSSPNNSGGGSSNNGGGGSSSNSGDGGGPDNITSNDGANAPDQNPLAPIVNPLGALLSAIAVSLVSH